MRTVCLLAIAILPLAAHAQDAGDEAKLLSEIRTLEREAVALATLNRLELTDEQAQSLLDLAKKAAAIQTESRSTLEGIREETIRTYTAFRDEDVRNTGFTREVEQATSKVHQRELHLRKAFCDRIEEIEKQAELTDAQRALLDSMRNGGIGVLFRGAPAARPAAAKPNDPACIRKELEQVNKDIHGGYGPLGRLLIMPCVAEALAKRTGQKIDTAPSDACGDAFQEAMEATRDLRTDINLLNLMNGMNYSVPQLEQLAECARQAAPSEGGTADTEAATRYRDALAGIVRTLEGGGEPDPAAIKAALKLRKEFACAGRPPQTMDALLKSVNALLTESQRRVLVDYKPCLVPPMNLKDPVRVGQASSTGPAERILDQARRIPEQKWKRCADEAVDKIFSKIEERGGRFADGERDARKQELKDILERTRALSDVDYQVKKAELAGELARFHRKQVLEDELKARLGDDRVVNEKIRSFVLDPHAVPLYEARIAQLREAATGKPVDLEKITPADHCKNGGCALKEK